MTRLGWIITALLVVVLLSGVALLMWMYGAATPEESSVVIEEPKYTVDPASLAIYTNGTHGFSFFYPAVAVLMDEFGTQPALDWRERAIEPGMLIVEVATPEGEVRLGSSAAEAEVGGCREPAATETAAGIAQVGSTTWNVFTSSRLGTDAERDVRSYRTVHNEHCYALEAYLAPGVSLSNSRGPSLILESFSFAE